jgi:hypothetical protein
MIFFKIAVFKIQKPVATLRLQCDQNFCEYYYDSFIYKTKNSPYKSLYSEVE